MEAGRRPLAWTILLSAVPLLAYAWLAALGAWPIATALGVGAVTVAVAAATVGRWTGDLTLLVETARRAGWTGDGSASPLPARASAFALTGGVAAEIGRLASKLSERAALIETLLGAEALIVESLPDPLLLLGPDRAVRRANQAARVAFGPGVASVLRHPALRQAIEGALADGAAPPAVRIDLAFGAPMSRDLLATVIGLRPPLPGGGRVLVLLSDRTRERAIERTRADFVANASHELRTPLASLIGFIETLRGPAADDPPAQARFLGIMAAEAARMNRLIDDLLSLSRIEISEHLPPQDAVAVASLIERVADAAAFRAGARGQTLTVEVPDGLPDLLADEDQLVQVLENLIDNAVKYGRAGGLVSVSAKAERGGVPPRSGIALSVADDGPGIARAHLPRLTERFYRAASARADAPSGTGLGLAIVKHIANRHRGTLRIESEEGAGSCFTIWLPALDG